MTKVLHHVLFYADTAEDWELVDRFTSVVTALEEARDSNAELAKLPSSSGVRQQLVNEAENLRIESRHLDRFLGIQRTCRKCECKTKQEV